MSSYAKAHNLALCSVAVLALAVVAQVWRRTWITIPQLGDGTGRGLPLPLLVFSFVGAVMTLAFPPRTLAFEQLRQGRHPQGRHLALYDIAAVTAILAPGLVVVSALALADGPIFVSTIVRDLLLLATLTFVALAWTSHEVASSAPVIYVLVAGLYGTKGDGSPSWWAFPLDRDVSGQGIALIASATVLSVMFIEFKTRRRMSESWIGPDA